MAAPQHSPPRVPLRPFRSRTPFRCSLPHLAVWEGGVSALCPAQRAQDKGGCVSTATAVPPGLGGAVPKRRSPPGTSRPCPPGALTARRGCWPGAVRMREGSAPQQSSLWVLRLLREPAVLRLVSFPHSALSPRCLSQERRGLLPAAGERGAPPEGISSARGDWLSIGFLPATEADFQRCVELWGSGSACSGFPRGVLP